ncbi:bifunctional DNA primase/polymerase [Kitasatospora aureofaciens]|uniref:bifunctional DNA primase/polymerase n=1 Tax=Kitasatospora aureofaciens TaxID=1894 RepID=UPI0033A5FBEB
MIENAQVTGLPQQALPTPRHEGAAGPSSAVRGIDLTSHQLGVALTWIRRGMPVVPCSRTDKGALVPGFGKDATADQLRQFFDEEDVRAWWTGRFKRAHVGLLTRRLVVVDLDVLKAGAAEPTGRWAGCQHGTDVLERLVAEAGADWPDTYTVVTPSGGLHLYFEQPDDGGPLIGCATGEGTTAPHLGPLVDVRGVGGYVIAAGSYSSTQGQAYTRTSPASLRPRPLPAWLLEKLRPTTTSPLSTTTPRPARVPVEYATRAERYADAALRGEVDRVASGQPGERNRILFAAARRLGELHHTAPAVLAETVVRDELLDAALRAGLRGGDREALATIRSGWTKGISTPAPAVAA